MKLLTNDKTYEDIAFRPTADGCVITAREAIEQGETLVIQADDGAELCRYTVADWLRCETDGGTLTLSNSPAPEPPPAPGLDTLREARQEANRQALADWLAAHPLVWTARPTA